MSLFISPLISQSSDKESLALGWMVSYTDGDITAIANEGTILVGFHLAGQTVLEPSAAQLEACAHHSISTRLYILPLL